MNTTRKPFTVFNQLTTMSVPQSEPHLPREVCPQAEADGQAAAPVDDPSHPHHGHLPRNMVIMIMRMIMMMIPVIPVILIMAIFLATW